MTWRIEANNKTYTGVIAGIPFVNGVASGIARVPDYFLRHDYRITEEPSAGEPVKTVKSRKTAS